MERNEGIEILDAGTEEDFLLGPEAYCCGGALTFLNY